MNHWRLSLIILFLVHSPATTQELTFDYPSSSPSPTSRTISPNPGENWISLPSATKDGAMIVYVRLDEGLATISPKLTKLPGKVTFMSTVPGSFLVQATAIHRDKKTKRVIKAGCCFVRLNFGGMPPPVPPKPNPNPPDPGPKPGPEPERKGLEKTLYEAWKTDGKDKAIKKLEGLYILAAKEIITSDYQDNKTVQSLMKKFDKLREGLMGEKLKNLRGTIGKHLKALADKDELPKLTKKLSSDGRDQGAWKVAFEEIATVLKAVQK